MTRYVPFLKLKSNEIMAIRELETGLRQSLIPFFDFPYKKDRTAEDLKKTAETMFRSISRNIGDVPWFYLDNYDVNSNLIVDGVHNYAYLLSIDADLPIIPVISIDRDPEHMQAVCEAKDSGGLKSDRIALRFVAEDFENFDVVKDKIRERLDDTIERFSNLDLILDCRVCLKQNPSVLVSNITSFINDFAEIYSTSKIIVTGSSIPKSIKGVLGTHHEIELSRVELDIFDGVNESLVDSFDVVLGDYGIVSPNYSDISISPDAILNVLAPKILYTFDRHHYIIRGGAIKKTERAFLQYNDFAAEIIAKPFYRGADYSFGDNYIEEKSRFVGKKVMPGTIIKPTINTHITYMLTDYV